MRWVRRRCPHGTLPPTALCCTDPAVAPEQIVGGFVGRWTIEVTFAEARAHLGLEPQRQWTTRAIGRTTPCLVGLFSLVVVLADRRHGAALPTRRAAWYPKAEATFSDALAAVRRHLWDHGNYPASPADRDPAHFPPPLWERVFEAAAYAA